MSGRLDGKVFLVTGATSGIGRATALRLAADGAAVVGCGRRADAGAALVAEIERAGGEASFTAADVTVEDDVAALVAGVVVRFGRLDGAFNNAASVLAPGPVADLDAAAWDAEVAVNLTSVFLCLKHELAAIERGAIVNNASLAGGKGVGGLAAYSAAKHGVVGLTRSVALEVAPRGVRVNALVTGNVDTPLYRGMLGADADVPRADLFAPNPAGRVAAAEEVAAFVAFLLGDEAPFITGAALAIDGGESAR